MPEISATGLPELKSARRCGNCACFAKVPNPESPAELLHVCMRNAAIPRPIQIMVPRTDRQGVPQKDRDGQVIMIPIKQVGLGFLPTIEHSVCYDGWRPVDALPGDNSGTVALRRVFDVLKPMLANPAGFDTQKAVKVMSEALADPPDSERISDGNPAESEGGSGHGAH